MQGPQSINQQLNDRAILHAVLMERFKAREVRAVMRFLDEHLIPDTLREVERIAKIADSRPLSRLTQARRILLEKRLQDLRDVLRGGAVALNADLRERLVGLAKQEAAWQVREFQDVVPVQLGIASPSAALLREVVIRRPMQGKFLREWAAEVGQNTARRVSQAIRIGIAQGEGVDTIVRRVRGRRTEGFTDGVMQATRREAEMVVRTAVNHTMTQAREAVFVENADIIKLVQWVSTLDSRVSQICAGLHGRRWRVGSGPRPPAHPWCRSTVTAILKHARSIPALQGLPPAQMASMDGLVPDVDDIGPWLKRQSRERQEAVLGKSKAALFRRGVVPIQRFVDVPTLRPLRYEELLKIERRLRGMANSGAN